MDSKIKLILERGVEEIIERHHLEEALQSGKKLRVKFGIDPTAPNLHLGHTVPLRKLRQFQEAGHRVVLIIGDFTATIGDPSGRSEERKPLSEKEVKENMKKYLNEAGKVIDIKKTEIHYNSEWHKKEGLKAILSLAKAASVQQVLKRADFQKRIAAGKEISLLEAFYPLLQGYDSVKVRADVEIGGTDQKFNLLMGRQVQKYFNMKEQDIMMLPLIEGTDGVRKMSKSYGNYIAISEKSKEMFGKIMSIPDSLIEKYFLLLTDAELQKNLGPYENKKRLARKIVAVYHGSKAATAAEEEFIKVFSKKEMVENFPELKVNNEQMEILEILIAAGIKSKSEARRLIDQKAVEINGEVKNNPKEIILLRGGETLKIGKKKFFKIKVKI
jgi:tyrosyl-tRNA synthetase